MQGGAEYGGLAGGQGSGVLGQGSGETLSQGWSMIVDNPAVAVIAFVTVLIVIAFFRTGRYRA